MNSDEIVARLETHLAHLKTVRVTLFNLAIGGSSTFAEREGALAGEVAKLITEIEINIASAKRVMEEWK